MFSTQWSQETLENAEPNMEASKDFTTKFKWQVSNPKWLTHKHYFLKSEAIDSIIDYYDELE